MSARSAPERAPKDGSRLNRVLEVGMRGAATSSVKYALHGNAKADWSIMYFDDYERYLKEWNEWKQDGWTNESEPLPRSGQMRTFKPRSDWVEEQLKQEFGA